MLQLLNQQSKYIYTFAQQTQIHLIATDPLDNPSLNHLSLNQPRSVHLLNEQPSFRRPVDDREQDQPIHHHVGTANRQQARLQYHGCRRHYSSFLRATHSGQMANVRHEGLEIMRHAWKRRRTHIGHEHSMNSHIVVNTLHPRRTVRLLESR